MRLCERNMKSVWVSVDTIAIDVVDKDGYFTGEVIKKHKSAVKMKLHLAPVTGNVSQQIFGNTVNVDLITVTNGNPFNENTVIFLEEPNVDCSNYTYTIKSIKESLNQTTYGLKKVI